MKTKQLIVRDLIEFFEMEKPLAIKEISSFFFFFHLPSEKYKLLNLIT
jgi:hypothetical protein